MLDNFNEIADQSKKWGGQCQHEQKMANLRDMLCLCELRDFGFEGTSFTWYNNEGAQSDVKDSIVV